MAALKQLRRMEAEAVVADGASDALAAIAKSAGDMGKAMSQAGQAVEQTDRRVSQSKTAFERTRDSVDKLGAAARQLAREKERINAAFDSGKLTDDSGKVLAVNAALAERNRLLALAEQKYQDIAKRAAAARAAESPVSSSRSGALSTPSSNDSRALAAANDNLSRSFGGLSSAAADALGALGPMGMAMQGAGRAATGSIAGLAGLTAAVGALSVAAIKAVQDQERLMGIFTQAAGAQAAQEYAFVRAESDRLGLSFAETASQYAKLAAASRDTALEGQATRDIFTGMAEAATALKMSGEETSGALNAIQQMISKGKVQAEELRGQLGERLPGAFQIAARAMGVTTMELDAMLQKGAVMADDFLPKLATELHRTFGGQAAKNADGLTASFNRLDTAVADVKRSVGDGGLATAVGDVAKQLTTLSKESNGAAGSLGATLGNAVHAAGDGARYLYEHADAVKTALVGLAAAKGAVVFLELATAIQAAGGAMAILNAAVAANPFALAALAVGALAAGLYQHWQRSKDAEEAQRTLAAATEDVKRINALTSEAIAAQSAELQANTLATAKNAEAKLAMADAEAQSAALRGRAQLDELRAEQARRAQNPASIMSSSSASSPVVIQQAERRVADLDVAAARARKSLDDAQDALGKLGQTSAKTAPAVNATAIAANRSAQILGTYKDSVKGLYPLEDALVERNKKRADILVALDAGVTGFTQAQKDLAAVDADYKTRVESITHADRDRQKAANEAEKDAEREQQQREKAIASVGDQIDKLKDETAQLGMTERERFVHNAALKAEKTLRDGLVSGADDYVTAVKKEAGALFDRTKAQEEATEAQEKAKKASEESAKHQLKTAEKATDDIVRYAGDTFADLFANTKGGWREVWNDMAQTARSTLARIAAEMLLRPIIAPTVQGVMGVSATAAASGAVGASNISGGNLLSLGSKFVPSSWTSGITSAIDQWGMSTFGIGSAAAPGLTAAGGGLAQSAGVMAIPGGVTNAAVAPGAVSAGLTSYLGPLGGGFALGGLLGPLLANGNKAVGGLAGGASGAAAGALIGSMVPGVGTMLGALLGGAGGGLGGLLGTQKPTVGPNSAAAVRYRDGKLQAGDYASDNDGNAEQARQWAQNAASAITSLTAASGGKLSPGGDYDIGHIKYMEKTGKFTSEYAGTSAEFTSAENALNDLISRAFKGLANNNSITGFTATVEKAMSGMTATTADAIASVLQLAKGIDDASAGLDGMDTSLAGITASTRKATAAQFDGLKDGLKLASDNGIGDDYKALLTRQLRSSFDASTQSYTAMETAMAQLQGQTTATKQAIVDLGLSMEGAEVQTAANTRVIKMQTALVGSLDTAINEASGKGYRNQLQSAIDTRASNTRDLAALGMGPDKAWELYNAQVTSILNTLDPEQMADVAAVFGAAMAGMRTAVTDTATAVTASADEIKKSSEDLTVRAMRALKNGDGADGYAQALTDQREIADATAKGMDAAYITGLRWVQGIEAVVRAQEKATKADSARADIFTRAVTASGNSVWAATLRFDTDAAQQRQTAWNNGLRGQDLANLDTVLAAERSQTVFQAAQQAYLTALDRQIQAVNDNSAAARASASATSQFVQSVQQALRGRLLDDKISPLSSKEKLDEATRQVESVYAKAKAGDEDARGQIVALLNTRDQLSKNFWESTNPADFWDSQAKLESLGLTAADQLDSSQQLVKLADQELKILQQAKADAAALGQKSLISLDSLHTTLIAANDSLQSTLTGVLAITGQLGGGTGGVVAPDKGGATAAQASAAGAWMADWFGRYNALLAANDSGSLPMADVQAQGGALWREKIDKANALPLDTAVWTAVVNAAAAAPHGGDTAAWLRGIAHDKGVPMFAGGGVLPHIPGLSTPGVDSVPWIGMPGEGVVNLRGMDVLGADGLAALNAGRWPANDAPLTPVLPIVRAPAATNSDGAELLAETRQQNRLLGQLLAAIREGDVATVDATRNVAAVVNKALSGSARLADPVGLRKSVG